MSPCSPRVSGELVRAYPSTQGEGELLVPGQASRLLLRHLTRLADEAHSVLIFGETGTGKTAFVPYLRGARALRVVNCAALGDGLLAERLRDLDRAPTMLFLDEVGELSPWGQAVLLHRLQQLPSQTRFVAATHRDLAQGVRRGSFSGELLGALSGSCVHVSPLRARREDIAPLALHFLRLGLRSASVDFVAVRTELLQQLERHDWPGNVRELRNAMLSALARHESGTLELEDLPDAVRAARLQTAKAYSR
jgi:transcriptional regulator with AAA-type ATPase domain